MSDPPNKSRPDSDSHSELRDPQQTEEGGSDPKPVGVSDGTGGTGSPTTSPPSSEDEGFSEEGQGELAGKMTFLEHLDELRKRILYSLLAVIVAAIGSWVFREDIFGFLAVPIRQVVDDDLVFTKVTDPITIYLKVAFVTGSFVAAPVVLTQVWLFIAPGLYRREKIYVIPFLFSSTALFLLGGMFAYYIILPTALKFLIQEMGGQFKPIITAVDYFSFEIIILLGMGLIFQLPVLVAFLSMFGMVTPGFLWRNFRYAFLLIVILAAVISPTPDALNLTLWCGPMVVLYLVSIGISWIFSRRRKNRLP